MDTLFLINILMQNLRYIIPFKILDYEWTMESSPSVNADSSSRRPWNTTRRRHGFLPWIHSAPQILLRQVLIKREARQTGAGTRYVRQRFTLPYKVITSKVVFSL